MAPTLTVYYHMLEGIEPQTLRELANICLPAAELACADRYRHQSRQCQYLVGRLLLRGLLAERLQAPAASFELEIGPYGKPILAGGPQFNVAHTSSCVAVAISTAGEVGIDIEEQDRRINPAELAGAVLHPAELTEFEALAPAQQSRYFMAVWCAKEAYVKALGRGIAYGLPRLRVDLSAAVIISPEGPVPLLRATPPPEHASALICLTAPPVSVTEFRVIDLPSLSCAPWSP